MRASLTALTFACLLFLETWCSAQTVNAQPETITAQNAAIQAETIGHSCTFQESTGEIESFPNCVLQDRRGNLFIAKEYVEKLKFNSYGLAAMWDDDDFRHKFMYVDRKGRAVIRGVPISDNWAEEFSDGLVRIVIDEKYGFADRHGKIVIVPRYDGAGPFQYGYAVVCISCRETCVMPSDQPGSSDWEALCEHRMMTGGEWFKIDKKGRVVARVPE